MMNLKPWIVGKETYGIWEKRAWIEKGKGEAKEGSGREKEARWIEKARRICSNGSTCKEYGDCFIKLEQEGKFGTMITTLKSHTTVHDMNISGLSLNPPQIRALVKAVGTNESLKSLSLVRKQITDDDGADIARNLAANKVLLKLEMDDNNMGPKTAAEIGKLISQNRFVRVVSLESNNLTNSGKEPDGVIAIAQVFLFSKKKY